MIHFPSLTTPTVFAALPDDLIEVIAAFPHVSAPDKHAVPLFGPYTFHATAKKRENESVATIDYAVLDFDGANHEGFDADATARILAQLAGYDCAVSTSHSHTADRATFRAVLRLTRPVLPGEWRKVFALLGATFPDRDENDSAVSQAYFYPSAHPDRLDAAWSLRFHGRAFDVDTLPALTAAEPTADGNGISRDALDRVIKRYRNSDDPSRLAFADQLLAVREGVPFAAKGERQAALFWLVTSLLRAFPRADAPTIAATLAPSLSAMHAHNPTDPGPSLAEIPGMVTRAKSLLRVQAETQVSPDPETELSDTIIGEIFAGLGCSDPLRHLVLQFDSDYFVATYTPTEGLQFAVASKASLVTQAKDKLRPFRVPLTIQSADKAQRMKIEDILERYGTPVETVIKSFCETSPLIRTDGAFRELTIPACRRRSLTPCYDAEVDRWIRMLGGDVLLDWISLALDPSEPLVALVMIGDAGTGKSLLAKELARVWTSHDPPALTSIIGSNFNADFERCPLVFADEDLPRDQRGHIRTADLREFIQRGRHAINAKHRQLTFLVGYPRVIAAANNDTILDFGASALTPADLEAIQARLRVIRVSRECARYLQSVDVRSWIERSAIAGHALWLAENRTVSDRGRFGLEPDDDGLTMVGHGTVSAVVEWLVRHLLTPNRLPAVATVDADRAVVRLRVQDLVENWNTYLDTQKPPTLRITIACKAFAGADGWIEIPWTSILEWVSRANWASSSAVLEAIAKYGKPQLRAVK